jgi:hypothetical protein
MELQVTASDMVHAPAASGKPGMMKGATVMKMDISQRQLYWGMGSSRQTREPEVREVWAVMEWINEGVENIDHTRPVR